MWSACVCSGYPRTYLLSSIGTSDTAARPLRDGLKHERRGSTEARSIKRWGLTSRFTSGMATAKTQDAAESKKKIATDTRMLKV